MKTIDSSGLKCPMPLLFLRRSLISINAGEQVCLISTDEKSLKDVPTFCTQMGHRLVEIIAQPEQSPSCWHFIVAKKEKMK